MMSEATHPYEERVRRTLTDHARLHGDVASLRPDDDLFKRGMTSHASVNVMLALEEEFDVEFPEEMLQKSAFRSIEAICASISQLTMIGDPR
jgi:acyl carrier protein